MTDHPPPAHDPERLEALLACLPGVLYVAEPRVDRPILHTSDGSLELTGYFVKDLEERVSLSTLVHAGDRERVDRAVECFLSSGTPFELQYRLVRADGSERWVWDRAFLVEAERGPEVRGCLLDVTQRSHLEGRNYAAQRHEAMGRISAGVAHQFNNLLTAILGSMELALKDIPSSLEPVREELREAQGAGQKAADLVQQLLAFTRPLVWKPAVIDLNDALRTLEGMLHRIMGPRVRLVLVLDPGLLEVSVDPRQIEHVILNLVMNAQEAMPSGGRIVVATGVQELASRALRKDDERSPGRYVTVSVTDTGEGIPSELRGQIFEPFFTTRKNRNGLGLSTAYGIVKQSGGMIRVSSNPGRGSTFTVFIPANEEVETLESRKERLEIQAGTVRVRRETPSGPTVLIVEDEESVRSVLIRMLSRQGFRVLEAPDGESAIRLSDKHQGRIDLLLCDVMLPGIRGVEVARAIADKRPETRVLMASGYVDPSELERLGVDGNPPMLHKPFTMDELVQVVARLMSAPPAPRPSAPSKPDEWAAGNGN